MKYFESEAQAAFDSRDLANKAQEVAEKDDNWLTKGIRWAGDGLGNIIGKAFEIPSVAELGLDAVGLNGAADFVHNVNGGLGQSAASVVTGVSDLATSLTEHPIETGKGLADIATSFGPTSHVRDTFELLRGKSPQEILEHKKNLAGNIWDSFTKGYKDTADKFGTEGAVAHVVGDIALAVASGGTTAEAQGGLKAASVLSKLGDLKVVTALQDFAQAGKAAKAVQLFKDFKEVTSMGQLDEVVSPALQSIIETNIRNVEKSVIQSAPEDPQEELNLRGPR